MSTAGDAPLREQELRLALVCYGGISLAVYMHGITKEVWHLARASQAVHAEATPPSGTARVYAELLREVADTAGVRLRVLPDILAGASAGGINAIFLAQAVSTGQSLNPLTELWLDGADVERLIDRDAAPASRFSKVWALPLAWMAAGRSADKLEDLDEATREEVRAKLSHFVRSRWFEPPFAGPAFTAMLLDAFTAMADGEHGPRLLPPGQPLDLFVTVTDFTGHPERLLLHSPPEVMETEHRLVFPFSDGGEAMASLAAIPELAFAARATSSFPGAFPPFTVAELDGVLAARDNQWPNRAAFLRRVLPRQAAAQAAERAVLIDGSVLANAPFQPAIDALRARPARREIDRRFVYIDPSPGTKFRLGHDGDGVPGFFQTILGALSELPRKQPIRDNLEAIAARSAEIERMRAITAAIAPQVDAEVEALFGRTLFLDRPTPARLVAWRRRAQEAAADRAGYSYVGYGQLKAMGVVDAITTLVAGPGGATDAAMRERLRSAIVAALRGRGLAADAVHTAGASQPMIDFLRTYDLAFRIRRLRFMTRRLASLERQMPAELEPLREAIYASLADYRAAEAPHTHAALRRDAGELRDDAEPLVAALATMLDLTARDAATDARLAAALADLPRAVKRPMLLTYLGFPFVDIATLPLLRGEGSDEFDPIKVDRIAPDDARAIRGGGAEATLKGIQFNSFGAFFSRAYRENDYLWGRLHGAERMIDIALSTLPAEERLLPGRVAAIKRAAFLAILDEEAARLSPELIATIRAEVG